jgi:hypothetical protein
MKSYEIIDFLLSFTEDHINQVMIHKGLDCRVATTKAQRRLPA